MRKNINSKKFNKYLDYAVLILVVYLLYNLIFNILDTKTIIDYFPYIFNGLWTTLKVAALSAFFGAALGILFAIMKNSNIDVLHKIVNVYVDIFRGTPMLVQLYIFYFGLASFGIQLAPLFAVVLSFSLNSAAYISEIIRSGINSIDKGQIEAAHSLGIEYRYIYKDIILPIAFRNILPALMNEFITLVKETSIVSFVGMSDLMRRYSIVYSQTYKTSEPLLVIAIIYYLVVKILTTISKKIEVKLQYD